MENRRPGIASEHQLGLTVRHYRDARGWSQRELAERMTRHGLKITQSQVAKTELGDRPVRLDEAVAYAQVFGLSLEQITSPPGIRPELESAGAAVRARYYELFQAHRALIHAQIEFLSLPLDDLTTTEEERAYVEETMSLTIEQLIEELVKIRMLSGQDGQHPEGA